MTTPQSCDLNVNIDKAKLLLTTFKACQMSLKLVFNCGNLKKRRKIRILEHWSLSLVLRGGHRAVLRVSDVG